MSDTPKTDLKGTHCTQCNLGEYQETTIYDDWQGNLHCTKCNHKTKRYESVSEGETLGAAYKNFYMCLRADSVQISLG